MAEPTTQHPQSMTLGTACAWTGASIGGVLAATMLLRITGLVDDFWFWLGINGFPVALYWTQSWMRRGVQAPRFANFIAIFATLWTIGFLLVPVTYRIVTKDFPYSKRDAELAKEDADLRHGERVYPAGYAGRLIYQQKCRMKEEEDIRNAAKTLPDPEQFWKRAEQIRKDYETCSSRIIAGRNQPEPSSGSAVATTTVSSSGDISAQIANIGSAKWLLIIPLFAIAGIGLSYATKTPLISQVSLIMAIIAMVYVAGSMILALDTSGAISIPNLDHANIRAFFWAAIILIEVIALIKGVVKKSSPFWFMLIIILLALLFDWIWFQKGVGIEVIKIIKNIRWV